MTSEHGINFQGFRYAYGYDAIFSLCMAMAGIAMAILAIALKLYVCKKMLLYIHTIVQPNV